MQKEIDDATAQLAARRQAEEDAQAASRAQADRYWTALQKLREEADPSQWEIIDRITSNVDYTNPTPADLARLRRLVHALNSQATGSNETEAAKAQLGQDISTTVRDLGKNAGKVVEKER